MRGLGGPLLTIGDLLSDLAVDGGDDPLVGVGDASAPSSPSAAQQAGKADPSNLSRLFEEHYNNLMKALEEKDPSWPSLMLKLCAALKTADKLVSCANTNAEQLLEKVKALEDVLERGDHAVAEIVEALQRSGLAKDRQALQRSGLYWCGFFYRIKQISGHSEELYVDLCLHGFVVCPVLYTLGYVYPVRRSGLRLDLQYKLLLLGSLLAWFPY